MHNLSTSYWVLYVNLSCVPFLYGLSVISIGDSKTKVEWILW